MSMTMHDAESKPVDGEEDSALVVGRRQVDPVLEGRASGRVSERQIREQVVRSTPEALAGEVGAYVQQTAHGQGSVYLRGRTGRHTLLMVDGFRLNHALFRQGPNQYLFTVEPLSIRQIEILRGGAAVSLGANALAGAILVSSKRPHIDPTQEGFKASGELSTLWASADLSRGIRGETRLQIGSRWGLYMGGGWVKREELEAAGQLPVPQDTPEVLVLEKAVPRFERDGRIQMGTGYRALSGELASRYLLERGGEWNVAGRVYRQYDTPRTDQCPPPEAPDTWCLNYDEQFRTHVYSTLNLPLQSSLAETLWTGISFQRQHERRSNDRENYLNQGRDAVNVWELRSRATVRLWDDKSSVASFTYGLDGTFESVSSRAWDTLVRSQVTREKSRGQYLDGSHYRRGEGWGQLSWKQGTLALRGGARYSYSAAEAPADEESESQEVSRSWRGMTVGGGGSWQLSEPVAILVNVEQGFAPPNLDDLTARQLTGQGYQIENPQLGSERSTTYEVGGHVRTNWDWFSGVRGALDTELWVFAMELSDGIERRDSSCPPSERSCVAARVATPFTLINLEEDAWIYGVEHQLKLKLPWSLTVREHIAYAHGEGPSPLSSEKGQKRPLSRIPPLNGGASV